MSCHYSIDANIDEYITYFNVYDMKRKKTQEPLEFFVFTFFAQLYAI